MDLKGARLLVIGGAGFIGSHVVDALTREDVAEIVVFDNFTRGTAVNLASALKDPRVRVFEPRGDVLQTDVLARAVAGVDGVFHLAALWLLHCQDFPRSAFDVNVRGTFNVLEACRDAGVRRLVFSSSASVYGDAVETPMTEDHPYNNRTFYGATKIAGEHMARAFHHRYGLDYVGLRYMNVYGPRQDHRSVYTSVIMKMLERIRGGEPPVIHGDGTQAYDFVYVEDCARANVLAMQAGVTDAFYNVGTGVQTSLRELCAMLLDETGSDLSVRYEPAAQTFVRNRVGSTERAARDLGFKAEVSLREGLRRVIAWWDSLEPGAR